MVQAILRLYSYVSQFLISFSFLALGMVSALSGHTTFEMEMLPWSGDELRLAFFVLGAFGLGATVLAFRGKLRFLFVAWTLVTVFLLGRGIFASGYRFDGESEFYWALFLLTGLFATVLGAWSRFRQPLGR